MLVDERLGEENTCGVDEGYGLAQLLQLLGSSVEVGLQEYQT